MRNRLPHIKREARKFLPLLFSVTLLPDQASGQTAIASRGNHQYTIQNNNQSLQVKYNGEISIAPDGQSITSISEGGHFSVQKTVSGNTKQLSILNAGGELQYEYSENGQKKSFEPEGKAWLAEILPELMRTSAIGAPSRVDRLYKEGGARLVLNEIEGLNNEQLRAQYFALLLQKDIQPEEIPLIISTIGRAIKSDHYRLELLSGHSQLFLSEKENISPIIDLAETFQSDHYKAELLQLILEKPLTAPQQKQVLQLSSNIRNDHFKVEILDGLLQQELAEEEIQWMADNLLPQFNSSHFKNEMISTILENQPALSSNTLNSLIEGILSGRSSFIDGSMLEKITRHPGFSPQNMEKILGTIGQFRSEHDKVALMKLLTKSDKLEPHLSLLLQQSAQLRSDHSRKEVLDAILNNIALNEEQLVEVVNSAGTIQSDFFKADFLKHACQQAESEKVKEAIRQTAKTIHSSHQYGEVLKCVG